MKTHKCTQHTKVKNIQSDLENQFFKIARCVKHWTIVKKLKESIVNNNYAVLVLMLLSRVQLFATPWTVAHQAPLSMGFSRQEYWSGVPYPPPGDPPNPGMEARSSTLQADSLPSEPSRKPPKNNYNYYKLLTNIHILKEVDYYIDNVKENEM